MHTDSEEEEEETQPLEHKKRTLPMFLQLPEQAMLIGKYVNDILNATFIADPLVKKPRTGLSLVKILNPHPYHQPYLVLEKPLERPKLSLISRMTLSMIPLHPPPLSPNNPHHPHNPNHHRKK
jgi:hypothetical protein